jgi:hypothetical protein
VVFAAMLPPILKGFPLKELKSKDCAFEIKQEQNNKNVANFVLFE